MSLASMNISSLDFDAIIKALHSNSAKLDGLSDLGDFLGSGVSTAALLKYLEKLFSGIRSCLQVDPAQMEVILKANEVLIAMIPDIQHSDDLEIQFAQLVPVFIENLGNPKAVVRKSTHKCIATYVKLSKKLEYVLLHIINYGLDSANTRTRQHSMLVIPALLSLKPVALDRCGPEVMDMVSKIIRKLRDPVEIVSKTSRKLLIELYKCYPQQLESQVFSNLRTDDEKQVMKAVFSNDEEEIIKVVTQPPQVQAQVQKKSLIQEEYNKQLVQTSQSQEATKQMKGQAKELSVVGKEILQSNPSNIGSLQVLDRIIYEAKEESRYPKAQNGLYYAILQENQIEALNENNQWKERTNAIEFIESRINSIASGDKKADFLPYATPFIGFMIQFIPDINFKISLSTIKIITKLLTLNLQNLKKYYQQLVTSLLEKLADSKVVIRQAVLKCCSILISSFKASTFCHFTQKHLDHQNWHVREGVLSLVALCIIHQSSGTFQNAQSFSNVPPTPDSEVALPVNQQVIQDLCTLYKYEDKQKIQQLCQDVLALLIDQSNERQRTLSMIQRSLGIDSVMKTEEEILNSSSQAREYVLVRSIVERLSKGSLPYINEEGLVEFPIPATSFIQPSYQSNVSQKQQYQQEDVLSADPSPQVKQPSAMFLENKRKEEQKKQSMLNSKTPVLQPSAKEEIKVENPDKIAMWLPSFSQPPDSGSKNPVSAGQRQLSDADLMGQKIGGHNIERFNETASSAATFLEDGRNIKIQSTVGSINHTSSKSPNLTSISGSQYSPSPFNQDKKAPYSQPVDRDGYRAGNNLVAQKHSLQTHMPISAFNNSAAEAKSSGYTPMTHSQKPRTIQSGEIKQRPSEKNISYMQNDSQQSIIEAPIEVGLSAKQKQAQPAHPCRSMNHSSGGYGFGAGIGGPQVSDKLSLLRSNQKYKPSEYSNPDQRYDSNEDDQIPSFSKRTAQRDEEQESNYPVFPSKRVLHGDGPIKAAHPSSVYMNTINNDDDNNEESKSPFGHRGKKPPLTTSSKPASLQQKSSHRAQSLNKQSPIEVEVPPFQSNAFGASGGDIYQVTEEPFPNPDVVYKQTLEKLKSGDWAKQFEGCNSLKRIAMFHKNLLSISNPIQIQVLKELTRLTDSLRSQLSKNALLTINLIMEQINPREIEPSLDALLPSLLKKASDTNTFISESADQCLVTMCFTLSEVKVFNALQGQSNLKSNVLKLKLAMCYNTLIEKMGSRVRQFQQFERLIQGVSNLLNEGAIEVRNMAKIGLFNLKNALGSQRELEQVLGRFLTNQKQLDKVRQILDKTDIESISNSTATRYGTSMRQSSLDSRSAGQFRGGVPSSSQASDGFAKFTGSDFAPRSINATQSSGFDNTQQTFKKSNLVSKPVDPQVMEDLRQIVSDLSTNDWSKRLNSIDQLSDFIKTNQKIISQAQTSKFIQIADCFCKLINDNNSKVQAQAQQAFRVFLLNGSMKSLIEQNLTMIVQSLNQNLQSTNVNVRDQGDLLLNMLEGVTEASNLVPPIVAQINLANNRSKCFLVERLANLIERVDKPNVIQKYVSPLLTAQNKIQGEAATNAKLKDSLAKLQVAVGRSFQP